MNLILYSEGVTVEYDQGRKAESETLREGVDVVGAASGGPGASKPVGLYRHYGGGLVRRDERPAVMGPGKKRQVRGSEEQDGAGGSQVSPEVSVQPSTDLLARRAEY